MIKDAARALEIGEKIQLAYNIRNTQRAIGTKLSSMITRRYGMNGLQPGHITVRLRGSAGQSLGAFAVEGLKLEVFGDANDYVGKGLSGGTIVVRLATASGLASNANTIIGNTVLYGATAGKLFAAGQAGERFAVRNPRRDGGDRGLRVQWLRVHDQRHRGGARPHRRQLRRRHDRRHGLRLRPR